MISRFRAYCRSALLLLILFVFVVGALPEAQRALALTPTLPPTQIPPTPVSIKVQYKAGDTNATDNQIKPHLSITGVGSVPLSDLKARYYFTRDGASSLTFTCDWAIKGCSNITGTFVTISPAVTGADTYLEVGFTAGAGSGNTGEIQLRINKSDWTNFNETGDYSFDPTKTAYADWNKVTLYRSGTLVWGTPPGGIVPTNTPTLITPTVSGSSSLSIQGKIVKISIGCNAPSTPVAGATVSVAYNGGAAQAVATTDTAGNYTANLGSVANSTNVTVTATMTGLFSNPISSSFVHTQAEIRTVNFTMATIAPKPSVTPGGTPYTPTATGTPCPPTPTRTWTPSPTPPPSDIVLVVTKLADTNDSVCNSDCSLREAVAAAPWGSTVSFAGGLTGTIVVSQPIVINKSLNIFGPGANVITISGNNTVGIIRGQDVIDLRIGSLTFANGNDPDPDGAGFAGAISSRNGTLTISSAVFRNNRSNRGAAISTYDVVLDISNTVFDSNTQDGFASWFGGAIAMTGSGTIRDSQFVNNRAQSGGAIGIISSGLLTVVNSTFSSNVASSIGGAIFAMGNVTVANSTFVANSAQAGGAIYNQASCCSGAFTVINSTLSANNASNGMAIFNDGDTPQNVFTLKNTIVSGSAMGATCAGIVPIIDGGHNLQFPSTSCGSTIASLDPKLGPLQNNGGTTLTMALLAGSPAINAGDNAVCAASPVSGIDQRHVARDASCDIGAYEAEDGATPVPTITRTVAALADLTVVSVTQIAPTSCGNLPAGVSAVISNIGTGNAGSFVVGSPNGSQTRPVGGLAAGASTTVNFNWISGLFLVEADINRQVTESNEGNNSRSASMVAPPTCTPSGVGGLPDLIISSARIVNPSYNGTCAINTSLVLRVVVTNNGTAGAGASILSINSTQYSVTALAAGQSATIDAPTGGPYTIVADSTSVVTEINETNNSLSYAGITATPPIICTRTPTPGTPTRTYTPSRTPTNTYTPSRTPTPGTPGLTVQIKGNGTDNNQQTAFSYLVKNTSSSPMSNISVRIYFTLDGSNAASNYTLEKYYDQSGVATISAPTLHAGSTYYITVSYGTASLAAGAQWELQTALHLGNWGTTYSSTNDWYHTGYALNALPTAFTATNYIPAYVSGTLVAGLQP